jgi:hypothetical protein
MTVSGQLREVGGEGGMTGFIVGCGASGPRDVARNFVLAVLHGTSADVTAKPTCSWLCQAVPCGWTGVERRA